MDKIVCVGKNYLEHAKELGDSVPEKPVLFLKPPSVLKTAKWGETLELHYPRDSGEAHFECEIVLRVGADSRSFDSVSLGLDLTLRTRQAALKKAGHPWTVAKVFRDAAVVGPWIPLPEFPMFMEADFQFTIDGRVAQKGRGSEMSMKPNEVLPYIEGFFPLCPGDLIYTGTPAGVGPFHSGSSAELRWGERAFNVRWI